MSVADALGGAAAFVDLPDGARGATALESKTNFVGAAPAGSTLIGRLTSPFPGGRRTQVWRTRVETEDGKPVALVTQTQMTL
jgi:1,4-dihydroxy-2-naphthoyl-CoA hydrolase